MVSDREVVEGRSERRVQESMLVVEKDLAIVAGSVCVTCMIAELQKWTSRSD